MLCFLCLPLFNYNELFTDLKDKLAKKRQEIDRLKAEDCNRGNRSEWNVMEQICMFLMSLLQDTWLHLLSYFLFFQILEEEIAALEKEARDLEAKLKKVQQSSAKDITGNYDQF